jgi:transposase
VGGACSLMWLASPGIKVYLGLGATDMRKSIDSLSVLVSEHLNQNPFSGHFFVFCNRGRTILKILYWDRNGFCLWHKRLEKDKFRWPEYRSEVHEISDRELRWLLEGLDIEQAHAHGNLDYQSVY